MPTFATTTRFVKDHNGLNAEQKEKFKAAVRKFVEDLKRDGKPRPGLRVSGMARDPEIKEITWDNDGRATFQYGDPIRPGEQHVIWRRIETHDIFNQP